MGYNAAKFFEESGGVLVGVQEHDGVVYNENGIDVEELKSYIVANGGVKGHPDFKSDSESIFHLECDVLIPAALEKAVHAGNANDIKAKLIAEGSNGGTTVDADHIL